MKLLETAMIYDVQQKILVAIDCIIFGFDSESLKLLLFKRKVEPLSGCWSLIGSFIKNDLSIEDGAKQILFESTGLDNVYLEELKTYGDIERDPYRRVISIGYFSLIRIDGFNKKIVEQYDARWFDLNEIPELILDHGKMVKDAIVKLRDRARHQPIGFNLLPEYFTILDLQKLYESIYQKELDPRNFRKKIISFDILTKTTLKDKSNSKKGAFLYKFNKDKFDKFIAEGYNFEV